MVNKATAALLVPVAAATMLTGCGKKDSSSSTAVASASTSAVDTVAECPTSNTRAFAKTRFVTDVGLAAGTFHRYIYKPYRAGSFAKGADGRTGALVKAGAVALVDYKLVNNAYENVQASPALCKALIVPLGQLKNTMGSMKGQILAGNLGAIATVDSLVKQVESAAASNGAPVSENADLTAAQKAER